MMKLPNHGSRLRRLKFFVPILFFPGIVLDFLVQNVRRILLKELRKIKRNFVQ